MKATATAKTLGGILTFYWRYDMNERIEGLWWKARIGYNNQNCDPEVLEKFAELIVRECIDALWTEECHTSDLAVEDYNRNCRKIKQHFGIGEVE